MTQVLGYSDLTMDRVDSIFSETGELLVSLPPSHAETCIAFIETVRAAHGWRKTPYISRLLPFARGLWVTLRIVLRYPRLFELGRVVVLNSSSQTWEQRPDGNVLFKFAR
jgi:hypothetical protein